MRYRWPLLALPALALAQLPPAFRLTLSEADQLALRNHPRIAATQLRARAAAQIPSEVTAGLQPVVTGNVTGVAADGGSRLAAGGLNNPVVYNRLAAGIGISQLLTDFGRTSLLAESARLRAAAETENASAVRRGILLDVRRAFFGLARAEAVRKVAEQTVQARQLVADQVAELARNGLKSNLDVSFANVNLADAKLLLAGAQNDVHSASAELATAIGMPAEERFELGDEPLPAAAAGKLEDLLVLASSRPEVARFRAEARAAARFAQAEKGLAYPSITAVASAGVAPVHDQQIRRLFGAAGFNVSIPVFNGGLFSARRLEAEFRAQAAEANLRELENLIARDVRIAHARVSTANERLSLTEQLLDRANIALELAEARYQLGLSSIVELSQAQLNQTAARIGHASARFDFQLQRAILDFESGMLR